MVGLFFALNTRKMKIIRKKLKINLDSRLKSFYICIKQTNKTMKKSINKSEVMKAAWEMFKASPKRTMAFFSVCLKDAWKMAKAALKARPSMDLQDVKYTILEFNHYRTRGMSGVVEAHDIIGRVGEMVGFASEVAKTVLKYKSVSEKQAYVIARAFVQN